MKRFGYNGELRQFSKGLDTGNKGNGNTCFTSFLHKAEVFSIIKKQLGYSISGAHILLLLKVGNIHFDVGGFFMLLRITSHTIIKPLSGMFHFTTIGKKSLVKTVHLCYQFGSMRMPIGCRHKMFIVARFISAQQKQI